MILSFLLSLLISNPAIPTEGTVQLNLEPVWETDEDELLIGLIGSVIKDNDGNYYLLDTQLSEVQVLSSEGQYLRTISGEGDGPGEIHRASELLLMPDNNIGIVQRWPGRIVQLSTDGIPANTLIPGDPTDGGMKSLREARSKNGVLVIGGAHNRRGDGERIRNLYISKFSVDGIEQTNYLKRKVVFDFNSKTINEIADDFAAPGRWDISANGMVYIAPERGQYHIDAYNIDGELQFSFNKEFKLLKRSSKELARKKAANEARFKNRRWYRPMVFSETEAAIKLLRVNHNGEVWILDSYGTINQPEGVIQSWDVFSPDGEYLRRAELVGPGRNNDRVFFVDESHIVIVHGFADAAAALRGEESSDDDSPVKVACYRIVQ